MNDLRSQPRDQGLHVRAAVQRDAFRLDVAFEVAPGEILGVLGPNGAGKSTLLRALAGLATVSAGSLRLDGQVLDDAAAGIFVPADRRPVGLVFQNYRLFPHLSVRDNVAFAARCQGLGRRAAGQRADRWLERLQLTEFGGRKPGQLSGGQAQRVAIARALAAEPALLLLDEPLAALDARTRLELRGALRRHLADYAGPTLLVTHDPLEAMVMTDRLLVIEDGRIVQQGLPGEVARRPATQYVARLVGLNLYAGTRAGRTGVALDAGGELFSSPEPGASAGDRVLLALRPAAIAVHTSRPEHSSPRNVWPGVIAGLELLIDRVRIQVDGAPPALVDVTPDAVTDLDLSAGAKVWLSAKATDLDVYPEPESAASGRSGGRAR
jgi:molybdate transport system ATP-binding protein